MFGRYQLEIPTDHKIENIHEVDILYDRNFGSILEDLERKYPDHAIIDIGANIGDTAAFIRSHCRNPLICVEGGAPFLPFLKKNAQLLGGNLSIVEKFVLTTAEGNQPFHYDSDSGTGGLITSDGKDDATPKIDSITVETLLEYQKQVSDEICLVKSDTDGFDGPIVSDVINRIDTNLYFECDPNFSIAKIKFDWHALFEKLEKLNYSLAIFDNFGLPMFFIDNNYSKIIDELLQYVEMQRSLRRISIYYFDIWAFRQRDHDIFESARAHYKRVHVAPSGAIHPKSL